MSRDHDLIVIGTGPAGQKAAVQAAKLGRRVLAVERGGWIGGVSVHSGTIPSKALREAVLVLAGLRSRRLQGVRATVPPSVGVDDLIAHTARIVETETGIVRDQLRRNGVELVMGSARFDGPHEVRVVSGDTERVYRAGRIVIAVGSRPVRPAHIPFDGERVLDNQSLLHLSRLPGRFLVYGAGVIGVEYATIFAALGCSVEIVDRRAELLPFLDDEIVELLGYQMWTGGIRLRLGEDVVRVEVRGKEVRAVLGSGEEILCDTMLSSQGRIAETDGLSLEKAGLSVGSRSCLEVDAHYRTKVPHIYAVGDVIGFPSLASTSMEQGRLAACHAFGVEADSFPELLPFGIYTIPEISMVGRSEADLRADGIPFASGRAHYREIAKGQIVGDSEGLLKILFHRDTRRVLGVHAIGEGATELIHIGQAVMAFDGTVDYFVTTVFNYPTFAECYRVAAFDGLNRLARSRGGG